MDTVVPDQLPRRERKKHATRRRILDAALALFEEKGFDEPTIDDIAAAADVGKGTIYNYFPSKAHIAIDHLVELETGQVAKFDRFGEQEGPLERILQGFLTYQFWLKRKDLTTVRVALAELILRPEENLAAARRLRVAEYGPLARVFTRLNERGLVRAGTEPLKMIEEWQALQFGLNCQWAMEGPPFRGTLALMEAQVRMFVLRWGNG